MEKLSSKYDVLLNSEIVGEVSLYDDGLRVKFLMQCQKTDDKIYRLYCRDGENTMPIGVAVPECGSLRISKTFSRKELLHHGISKVSECFLSSSEPDSAEARPKYKIDTESAAKAEQKSADNMKEWQKISDISQLFTDDEFAGVSGEPVSALFRDDGEEQYIAISASPDEPFPLMPVFCFGEQESINGREYIVFKIKNGKLS